MDAARRRLLACAAMGLCAALPAWSASEVYDADSVKAAFLYRFTGYVDWPEEALRETTFTIAVLGSPAIGAELERVVPSHLVKGLPAAVRTIQSIDQLGNAQMLFVGADYPGSIKALIDALGARPVLVVTDREHALDDGSAVNFLPLDRRVRFEISLEAAQKANLKVGPSLLAVAARVRGAPRS
ncbi:MAG TPA: YfiR family protein [Nevskiaceae bacterium]|nr:YfiR family protein [Nevskiaceae bacterium]